MSDDPTAYRKVMDLLDHLRRERDEARAQYNAECDSRRFAEGDRDEARRERDEARARVEQLISALERTEANFRTAVNGRPVRDMAENLAENRAAIKGDS